MKHYYNREGKIVNIRKLSPGWYVTSTFTNEHGAIYVNVRDSKHRLISILKYGTKEQVMKGWK